MPGGMTSLLLVGRSGHGKSSTGNSILGEKVFQPKSNVTEDSQNDGVIGATREVNGRKVQVVDATGLADNDQEFPENAAHFIDLAEKAIQRTPQAGYTAIVLVLKYGIRFTKQEAVAVQMIKSLFGHGVIQRHGIIVMTCGDQFERDMEDKSLSFRQWCGQQEGEVKRLMKECGQRCLLFDNKTKDPDRQRQHIQQLMDMVDQVKDQVGSYSDNNFQAAEPGRKKLLVMVKVPQLEQKVKDINQELEQVEGHDASRQTEELETLRQKIAQIEVDLQGMDKNAYSVSILFSDLNSIKTRVEFKYQQLKSKGVIQKKPGRADKPKAIHLSTDARDQVSDASCHGDCGSWCCCCWQSCRMAVTSLFDWCCTRCCKKDNDGRNHPA